MKRIIVLLCTLQLCLALPGIVFAQDLGTRSGGLANSIWQIAGGNTNVTDTSLSQTIGQGIKVILGFVGTIFFVLTIYAGFMWMTAQGNDEKVQEAQKILQAAVVGMVIVLAAYSITFFALKFTGSATTPPTNQV